MAVSVDKETIDCTGADTDDMTRKDEGKGRGRDDRCDSFLGDGVDDTEEEEDGPYLVGLNEASLTEVFSGVLSSKSGFADRRLWDNLWRRGDVSQLSCAVNADWVIGGITEEAGTPKS
mmetsp:Transcript_18470/g.30755  ORF Transcript_18470/g.30755 Transcript_18470/m.30755 type:complete len:118 (+) Transcript_18470:224-577(+)